MEPREPPNAIGNDGDCLEHDAGWGTLRVRAGSLAALALDPTHREQRRREHLESGVMDWSLGAFADLLWMLVPESRAIIFEHAREEFEEAIEHDEFLSPIGSSRLASALYTALLLPALGDLPAQKDLACRILDVLRRVILQTGASYRDVFGPEMLLPLEAKGLGDVVADLAPELVALTRESWGWT